MSTFTTQTKVDLDEYWVEDLLVTAFDRQYGGSQYWLATNNDILMVVIDPHPDDPSRWAGVKLTLDSEGQDLSIWRNAVLLPGWYAYVGKAELEYAWARVVDERPIRGDLVEQLLRSQREGALDVDADAADCLVQFALFGQVIYG